MKQISFWPIGLVASLLMAMPATVIAQAGELTLDDLFATPKLTGLGSQQQALRLFLE